MLQLRQLIQPIVQELHPHRLFPSFTVSLVAGVLEIMFAISLSALIFSDDLSEYLPTGIGIALFSILMLNAVVAWMSSLPGVVVNVQESSAVLTAVVVHTISMNMPASASATEKLLTVLVAIALISIITGIFFFALGWFKLGNLIRFVPYPVVGGFLAGTGWVLVYSSLRMMTNVPLGFSTIVAMLSPSLLIKWFPGLVFAVLLLIILRHFNHFLILPGILLLAIALFYIVLKLTGTSINEANSSGLLIGALPAGNLWRPFSLWELSQVNWLVIFGQVSNLITIPLVSIVTLLLNATSIEVVVEQDIDLNRELQAAGVANIAAGCGGGIIGFHGVALSALSHKVGTKSRLVGFFITVIAVIALFTGAVIFSYLPKMILGGLLLFLGLDFLVKWVYDSWFELPKTDSLIILLILIVIATFGFLQGVGIGLLLAVVLFVINYSQISAIKNILSGVSYHSHMVRQPLENQALQASGKQICILELQGFIFFGTAYKLVNQIRQLLTIPSEQKLRFVVLDLHLVNGIDSSTVFSFTKMRRMLSKQQVSLVFTTVQPAVHKLLRQCGCLETQDSMCQVFTDLDRGIEWCENQILETVPYCSNSIYSLQEQLKTLFGSAKQAEKFISYLQPLQVPEGKFIFKQGELPDGIYFVESGQVSVLQKLPNGQVKRLQSFGSGGICGEISFYTEEKHSASAITERNSSLYCLCQEALLKMEIEAPQLVITWQEFIIELLAERLKAHEAEWQNLLEIGVNIDSHGN